uniref:Nitric oxide synthase n=3 Tax=Hirondellea gigas TaxID=1518452 RepID=A0A2P2IBF2_9CRUS
MKDAKNKPLRLRNYSTNSENYDFLHSQQQMDGVCTRNVCNTALMFGRKTPNDPRPTEEVLRLAKEFIDEYYQSIKRFKSEQHLARWVEVEAHIEKNGNTYDLTQTELVYGAKLAWRNASRCIGRIQWSKLQVFDARFVTTASGMFEAICTHVKYATNKGNIRSAISIFPPRTDGKHDFRVWNSQILSYGGYKNEDGSITGDPLNVEFTELCTQLGWKSQKTRWDILPLVLSANGHDPEWFDFPEQMVLTVHFSHPDFDWFKELGLQWYTLPAVSGMLFDCGGLLFPAAPFNGWYMGTEIGARDLGDVQRYNMLETVALKMGLDTHNPVGLWKDRALVELNVAVLYSFQLQNITIVDHHTAAETFMKHYENEQKLRGGCPADWVWIVPPMSGSVTPVFHQEMSTYYLRPSYEYQEPAWKTHVWKKNKDRDSASRTSVRKPKRKFRFKEIARAVKFTSKLFGKALSKRIKATILYATETGKSEMYAKQLCEIFGHTFNAQVYCMDDYDIIDIEHEALVLVVTSTFGNGDPPENGEKFAKTLYAMKTSGATTGAAQSSQGSLNRSLSFMRMNSQTDVGTPNTPPAASVAAGQQCSWSNSDIMSENDMGALSNVRFAVFSLGSSAYPNFCAFGKYVDTLLSELGGERLVDLTCGDELAGQEQQFNLWAKEVFTLGCETFCLDDDAAMREATAALKAEGVPKSVDVKLVPAPSATADDEGLARAHNKKVYSVPIVASINLHGEKANRWTQQVIVDITKCGEQLKYEPGDHFAVIPANQEELVKGVISKLIAVDDPDKPVKIMVMKETQTPNGTLRLWEEHKRLPSNTIRQLLTRYCDITTPPTPNFLRLLSAHAGDNTQKERLDQLASDAHEYEEWKHQHYPHLLEVLEEFPSVELEPALLLSQLPLLQSRIYSISSSPAAQPGELHLTVAVVIYRSENGKGPTHYGVCSNFLRDLKKGDLLQCFVRSAQSFHLPSDESVPIVLVGPGTGVAPFRGFWQHRLHSINNKKETFGEMSLFFGCRTRTLDLYGQEKEQMRQAGVLTQIHLALSREQGVPKTYVQDQLVEEGKELVRQLVYDCGHFYVCGDCTMAECVFQRLKTIFLQHSKMNKQEVENYMIQMRDENRYHEDIFGITLRTEEIHRQSRETARKVSGSLAKVRELRSLPLSQSLSGAISKLE